MCGLTGLWSRRADLSVTIGRMTDTIVHRGPDSEGSWIDGETGLAFGHRRLAIVDLSAHGHQPMISSNGRWVISYNGEIYNHGELRRLLEEAGHAPAGGWRGHSDTETLIEAISAWGVEQALQRSVGMFALAVWDRSERALYLARDRFGEKPLYYGWVGPDFLFASELKAIRAHPGFDGEIDRRAVRSFLARTYIPAPLSIYRRIFKLLPGTILRISDGPPDPVNEAPPIGAGGSLQISRYWDHEDIVRDGLSDPFSCEADALNALEQALSAAISDQSVADVPVGAFLSGGIDSSTVVALYQTLNRRPVNTYTIGFAEAGFDESVHAAAVARHLGTDHHEHHVTSREAREVIPLLPSMYDEPFADSSQIPTYLVSRFARRDVTVALTGDGGDELFAGYNRHVLAPQMWRAASAVPFALRRFAGPMFGALPSGLLGAIPATIGGAGTAHRGAKLRKAFVVGSRARSLHDVYRAYLDEWEGEQSPALGSGGEPESHRWLADVPDVVAMTHCDAVGYLPDDILCKVDRASMAVSLETRVPFLDHRVAAVAARVPVSMKVSDDRGKMIVRKLLERHVPASLFDRPKAGFAVPVGQWIRGDLREWAEHLLDPAAMKQQGWLDPAIVQRRWQDHLSGRRDSTPAIWAVLMFQAWLEQNRGD